MTDDPYSTLKTRTEQLSRSEVQAVREELAKATIREVLFRYCRGVDRADAALIASAYHSDAYEEHGPVAGLAQAMVAESVSTVSEKILNVQHALCNILIELDGEVAQVEAYFIATQRRVKRPEIVAALGGRYLDRFERRDGLWRIARRKVVADWTWRGEQPADALTESLFALGRSDRDDPVFRAETWAALVGAELRDAHSRQDPE